MARHDLDHSGERRHRHGLSLRLVGDSSLKLEDDIFVFPPQWIPDPVRFQNYSDALTYKPFDRYVANTLFIVVLNEIAILASASFLRVWICAHSLSSDLWFAIVLSTMMVPYFVLMVPQFVIFTRLRWIDTFLPLTVPFFFGGGAFNIFVAPNFSARCPKTWPDLARIDGSSDSAFTRIMLPLAKPALITVAIFTFLQRLERLHRPLALSQFAENFTVAIGLATFHSVMRTRWDLLMAASTAVVLPVVVLFFFLQRYFIQGIVMSGIRASKSQRKWLARSFRW
ncbi:MAG: carbohydrate ABC transporter permease [Caldilineaceae bacterium]